MDKKVLIGELEHCLREWDKQGHCTFGRHNECDQCAAPYLTLKLISGEIIHGNSMPRYTLNDWKKKLDSLKETYKR